jgi:hypothetical protein
LPEAEEQLRVQDPSPGVDASVLQGMPAGVIDEALFPLAFARSKFLLEGPLRMMPTHAIPKKVTAMKAKTAAGPAGVFEAGRAHAEAMNTVEANNEARRDRFERNADKIRDWMAEGLVGEELAAKCKCRLQDLDAVLMRL